MFTGIIQHIGRVTAVSANARRTVSGALAHRLEVDLGPLADGLRHGASVAVNGACLTAASQSGTITGFDVVPETWSRTTLHRLRPGEAVNLERSARLGDPIDGHLVQGHVEAIGTVIEVDRTGGQWCLWTRVPAPLLATIVEKGSVALDGTSLTVVAVGAERFSVALVPTTLDGTVLGQRKPGDMLNVESDILARLVARRMAWLTGQAPSGETGGGVSWEALRAGGYVP